MHLRSPVLTFEKLKSTKWSPQPEHCNAESSFQATVGTAESQWSSALGAGHGAEGGEVPLLYLACSPTHWSAQVGRSPGDGTDQLGEHQWGPEVSGAGMRRQQTWAGIPPHPHTPHGYTPSARLLSARADRSECPE
ncbi:hypothetical protein SRHO_G00230590 [Serrasalmus rhombeus]